MQQVVEDGELRSAALVTPILLAFLVLTEYRIAPVAAVVGLALGPAVTYVKNVAIDDQYRRSAFVLLVVGAIGGMAFVGWVAELLWLLLGYNASSIAVGLYERRVRPLVAGQ